MQNIRREKGKKCQENHNLGGKEKKKKGCEKPRRRGLVVLSWDSESGAKGGKSVFRDDVPETRQGSSWAENRGGEGRLKELGKEDLFESQGGADTQRRKRTEHARPTAARGHT